METSKAISVLASLAQSSRLEVFRVLVAAAPAGLLAGEIGERLAVPPATLSFHLKHLAHAELVTSEREGRAIRYRANVAQMNALIGFLTDDCCAGTPSACFPRGAQGAGKRALPVLSASQSAAAGRTANEHGKTQRRKRA